MPRIDMIQPNSTSSRFVIETSLKTDILRLAFFHDQLNNDLLYLPFEPFSHPILMGLFLQSPQTVESPPSDHLACCDHILFPRKGHVSLFITSGHNLNLLSLASNFNLFSQQVRTNTMRMRSFATTFLVLLVATLNPANAYSNYSVLITRGAYDEADCTGFVNAEIDQTIKDCAALATGTPPLNPKRKLIRRRALRTMPASSRRLACSGSTCSPTCIMLGHSCSDTCGSLCGDRRLEEEFLGGDAVESIREERELNPTDDVLIYVECKKQLKNLARDATHNCLGEFNALEIEVVTSD
jgi:hypothetical protein